MGKGDQKTRKGKITRGTYGVRRPKKKKKPGITNYQKPLAEKKSKEKEDKEKDDKK